MNKHQEIRILLMELIGIINQASTNEHGEIVLKAKEKRKFNAIKQKYDNLCEEENSLDKELWITQEEFMNYKKSV